MSKIINCEVSEDCKPWHAPDLDITNDSCYDFKKSASLNAIRGEKQKKETQQSYERSFAKGYMEGLDKGQKEIRDQVGSLHSILAALAMPLSDIDTQVVDELVQLCMAVVKQMIRRELKISPGEVVAVVREALSLLPAAAEDITLELHPDDAKIIRDTLVHSEINPGWNIIEDALLTRGGCRVLTSKSRIDATVEKRMKAVIAEVMGGERKMDRTE